jgi:hypothetical protein
LVDLFLKQDLLCEETEVVQERKGDVSKAVVGIAPPLDVWDPAAAGAAEVDCSS